MVISSNKRLVCITGSVWSGSRSAPRHLLVKNGFQRPTWFTTQRPVSDAGYRHLSETEYHLLCADDQIIAFIEYAGGHVGILKQDLATALRESEKGALVVGPAEIAAQIADQFEETVVFTLKERGMTLSPKLHQVKQRGQLHRVDVDVLQPGSWTDVHAFICNRLGLEMLPDWR